MAMLQTEIHLLPGRLRPSQVRKVLDLCLGTYRWFVPARYGRGEAENRLESQEAMVKFLVRRHSEWGRIAIDSQSGRDQFVIGSASETSSIPYGGDIVWWTAPKSSAKWRAAHAEQIATLMKMLKSPLALSGDYENYVNKVEYWVPDPEYGGMRSKVTTVGYQFGLSGVYWRNFYGPMFVRLFGDRLATLPKEYARDLGDDLWLVQPYELPQMAGTPEAKARERAIIEHLGPECFYDHERRAKPTRLPELPPVPLEDSSLTALPPSEDDQRMVQERLTQYWDWATREWEAAGVVYRKTDRGYLLLAGAATDRTKAVLDWAYSNLDNPLFFRRTPEQVAHYLQAKSDALVQPSAYPRPELARIREALGSAAFDALLDLIPAMGDVEAALRSFAEDDPEARELLPRVRSLRQLAELLSFVPRSRPS